MGETRSALRVSRQLVNEPSLTRPLNLNTKGTKEEEKLSNLASLRGSISFSVLLDNIRSAWNVGSILRSADGFGFMHAYLCGITPTADNEAVTKTSLGAEDAVPWSYHKDAVKLVNGLKKEDWKVYALEEDDRAISISPRLRGDAPALEILIIGNEVTGVDPELLDLCDAIFHIPMRGEKKSFNVAIAFGIAAYALTIQKLES